MLFAEGTHVIAALSTSVVPVDTYYAISHLLLTSNEYTTLHVQLPWQYTTRSTLFARIVHGMHMQKLVVHFYVFNSAKQLDLNGDYH
jgi:hypothetical protein